LVWALPPKKVIKVVTLTRPCEEDDCEDEDDGGEKEIVKPRHCSVAFLSSSAKFLAFGRTEGPIIRNGFSANRTVLMRYYPLLLRHIYASEVTRVPTLFPRIIFSMFTGSRPSIIHVGIFDLVMIFTATGSSNS